MVPRPRAPKGLDRPAVVRDRGRAVRSHIAPTITDPVLGRPPASGLAAPAAVPVPPAPRAPETPSTVALTRTPHGWAVIAPARAEMVDGIVEGLTLADLVMEELGGIPEPDRSARRSARGSVNAPEAEDPRDARIAALERTVAQLEHALAARVATERAIGVLVERYGVSPREAFDALRQEARAQSRAVQVLARELLDGVSDPCEGRFPSADDAEWAPTAAADGRS